MTDREKRRLEIENRGIMAQFEALSRGKTKEEASLEGAKAIMEFILDTKIHGSYSVDKEKLASYKKALAACAVLKEKGLIDYDATPADEAHECHSITIKWKSDSCYPLEISFSEMQLFKEIMVYGDGCSVYPNQLFVSNVITAEI